MVETPSPIVVLGIGNLLMHDDGVGIHLIRKLEENYIFKPQVPLIDGGTMGSELLPYFEADKIVIVDAVNFNEAPGFVGTIENDDILTRLTTKLSMHHLGLTDVLSQVKLLGITPAEIYLVGVQPETMLEMTMELSDAVAEQLDKMVEIVRLKLKEWGVDSRLMTVDEKKNSTTNLHRLNTDKVV